MKINLNSVLLIIVIILLAINTYVQFEKPKEKSTSKNEKVLLISSQDSLIVVNNTLNEGWHIKNVIQDGGQVLFMLEK